MNIKYLIFLLVPFVAISRLPAQQKPTIQASVDKSRILIGEPLVLTIETYFPAGVVVKEVSADSLPHFEQLEKSVSDTIRNDAGLTVRYIYRLTSFDSGHWVIPPISLSKSMKSDTIGIDVVFSEFNPQQDYHDIKDIIEAEPLKKVISWWWYVAGSLLMLGILIFYFLRKKKTLAGIMPVPLMNPYEEAMDQLEKLSKKQLQAKEFHSLLTDIFRQYIFRKKGILSLQKTTDDLVVQIKGLVIDTDSFEKLVQSLRLSDFVKFAKYESSAADDTRCLLIVKDIIQQIEKSGSVA
jgi:hypothetical protein